ncbi:MAG: hypothetical protein AAF725_16360 [Acidobacteriota bacterium]
MNGFHIIGATWRRGGTEGVARFTVPESERPARLPELRRVLGAEELIYLATCNRVEILVSMPRGGERPRATGRGRRLVFEFLRGRSPERGEAEQALRLWSGEGALEHLLLVASGLDSAQLGEREIRGQLRDSFREAQRLEICGPRLSWAVTEAVRVARHVERSTAVSGGRQSLAGIGIERVEQHLRSRPGRVALVGVSPMTERCGAALAASGVECLVVNRSEERGLFLARRLGGCGFRPLANFLLQPGRFSAVVTAVRGEQPLLGEAELGRLARAAAGQPPLLVDFGVPPNADPEAAVRLGFERLDMEAISAAAESNRSRRLGEVAAARESIDRALEDLRREAAERETSPVLAAIHRRYRQTALDGAERLMRRQLPDLEDDQREAVEAFALNLAKRLAHVPTLGLRALASEYGRDAVETFLEASGEGLDEILNASEDGPRLSGAKDEGEAA